MSTKDDSVSIVLKREAIFAVRDVVREKVEHLDQLVGDSLYVDDLVDVEVLRVLRYILGVVDGVCDGLNGC